MTTIEAILLAKVHDLTITVGAPPQKRFLVNRSSMRQASPVWDRMLDPSRHFKENTSIAVDFPADDADAFGLVLRAVHMRHHQITEAETQDLPLLKQVAALGDKYGMIEVLRLFLTGWVNKLRPSFDVSPHLCEALWIADHCGEVDVSHDSTFYDALKCLVYSAKPSVTDSEVLSLAGHAIDGALPSGVYEAVLEARKNTLDKLYLSCITTITTAKLGECPLSYGIKDEERKLCKRAMLGHLVLVYGEIGTWPDAGGSPCSLREIERKLRQMQPCTLVSKRTHDVCSSILQKAQDRALAILKEGVLPHSLVPQSMRDELRKQAERGSID